MNTDPKLLPCPFCGEAVYIDSFMGDGFRLARVAWEQIRCEKCRIETEPEQPGCVKPELRERWNTRDSSLEAQCAATREALEKLVRIYEIDFDDARPNRPDWLDAALSLTAGSELLERLRKAEAAAAHMTACRALLNVPSDEVLAEAIKELLAEREKLIKQLSSQNVSSPQQSA